MKAILFTSGSQVSFENLSDKIDSHLKTVFKYNTNDGYESWNSCLVNTSTGQRAFKIKESIEDIIKGCLTKNQKDSIVTLDYNDTNWFRNGL
tara:strand:+ start:690 stop:965 length:276 start_codon:yes stop_codon:yes gene_type:complete